MFDKKSSLVLMINMCDGDNSSFIQKLSSDICLAIVNIPGGQFLMGSSQEDLQAYENEKPQHLVTIQPFFMSKYLITQEQWQAIASLSPVNFQLNPQPSKYRGVDHPVEQISWFEAVEFCDRLSRNTIIY